MITIDKNLKLSEIFDGMVSDKQIIRDDDLNQTIVLDKISKRILVFRNCTGFRIIKKKVKP